MADWKLASTGNKVFTIDPLKKFCEPKTNICRTLDDFILRLKFTDNSSPQFDIKPSLNYPVFEPLKEKNTFDKARVFLGSVKWDDEIDMFPDTLFLDSEIL